MDPCFIFYWAWHKKRNYAHDSLDLLAYVIFLFFNLL